MGSNKIASDVDKLIKWQRKRKSDIQEEAELAATKAWAYNWRMPILIGTAAVLSIGSAMLYSHFLDSEAIYSRAPTINAKAQSDDKLDDLTRRYTSETNWREFSREIRRHQFGVDNKDYTNSFSCSLPTNRLFKVRDVRNYR